MKSLSWVKVVVCVALWVAAWVMLCLHAASAQPAPSSGLAGRRAVAGCDVPLGPGIPVMGAHR